MSAPVAAPWAYVAIADFPPFVFPFITVHPPRLVTPRASLFDRFDSGLLHNKLEVPSSDYQCKVDVRP